MKKKHPLYWMGLLGLLGFLSIFIDNVGYIGFFGFFGFFGFGRIKNDERLEVSINRAARNAFVTSLIVLTLGMIIQPLTDNNMVFAVAFPIVFVLQILVFTFSFSYYDRVGE